MRTLTFKERIVTRLIFGYDLSYGAVASLLEITKQSVAETVKRICGKGRVFFKNYA